MWLVQSNEVHMENQLVLRAHPFSVNARVYPVRAGQTLQAMLHEAAQGRDIGPTVRVEIGGYEVPRQFWAKVKPKAGIPIHCTVMPAGGGSGRKLLRTVALVALTVFSAGVATGTFLGASGGWGALSVAGLSGGALAAGISILGPCVGGSLLPLPASP